MIVEQLRCDQCHTPILTATRHLQLRGLILGAPRHAVVRDVDMRDRPRDFCGERCLLAYVRGQLRDVDRESVWARGPDGRDPRPEPADCHQFGGLA